MWRVLSLLPLILGFAEAYFNDSLANYFMSSSSFGDIHIYNNDVIISLAPDEKSGPKLMAYFCADYFNTYVSMGKVVSRQLGYKDTACSVTQTAIDYSNTPIQKSIYCNCSGSESHILRCCTVPQVYEDAMCSYKLVTRGPCSDDESLYRLGNTGNKAYNGQILLFPPAINSNNLGFSSPSMGLVAVKKEGKGCTDWRFVYKDNYTVDHSIVSTFCRQMGYTDVVSSSIMTRREAEDNLQLNFTYWNPEITDPYLLLSNISCKSNQTCLACCNKYLYNESCSGSGTLPSRSRFDNILVIRCTFFMEEHVAPSGSKESCQFTDGKHTSYCKTQICMDTTNFMEAVTIPSVVLFVFNVGLFVICCYLCIKCQCKKRCQRNNPNGYERIEGDNNNNKK